MVDLLTVSNSMQVLDVIINATCMVIIECTLQDTPTELPPAASCPVTELPPEFDLSMLTVSS